jgi:threonine dehydrogenase-like Zn-dependent dehydrogenase
MTSTPSPTVPQASYVRPFANQLPANARLLVQAGAADGALARQYRKIYPASSLLAVDADPARAQQARGYADRVYQADLDTAGDAFYQQLEWADGWFFDATLEQLANPLRVLAQIRKVIHYDACIVARIANSAYWDAPADAPRNPLVIANMLELFQRAGFRVVSGILLNQSALPADVEAALRLRAQQTGIQLEDLIEQVQPSHYLIKAMPA